MNRKSTEERQKEIIRATLELLDESGVQNLTIAHIAERVGISEAALYRHFDGKLDIIAGIIEFVGNKMEDKFPGGSAGENSALEDLKAVFLGHMEFIETTPGTARLLFSDEVHFNDKKLRKKLKKVLDSRLRLIESVIERGQTQGTVRDDISPSRLALAFIGLVQSRVLVWSLAGRKGDLSQDGEALWESFESMIRA